MFFFIFSDASSTRSSDTAKGIYPPGTRLRVRYNKGKVLKAYEAKVLDAREDYSGPEWLVHYAGWNNRYDEWVRREQIVEVIQRGNSKTAPSISQIRNSPAFIQKSKVHDKIQYLKSIRWCF